ncbi:hypothetical protein [Ferviditalea candida]|uniref:Uncharacterized protein n=1 Tax=Ferviditalea candida TaxID=3108399 RepID=A0ABU5ZK28_9BACL|nr:hypothetical protein [Paenibacillaceae bacterium T2]
MAFMPSPGSQPHYQTQQPGVPAPSAPWTSQQEWGELLGPILFPGAFPGTWPVPVPSPMPLPTPMPTPTPAAPLPPHIQQQLSLLEQQY